MLYKSASGNTSKVLRRRIRNRVIHTQAQVEGQKSSNALAAELTCMPGKSDHGTCPCHRNRLLSLVPLCRLIPTRSFGSSHFTTPTVALLRTLLPAWPYSFTCVHARPRRLRKPEIKESTVQVTHNMASDGPSIVSTDTKPSPPEPARPGPFGHLPERLSTLDFLAHVSLAEDYSHYRVISMTWVKALASHMSHEFVQFVVEDPLTGRRDRLLSDRQETGDWIIVPEPNTSTSSKIPWQQMTPYKRRHTLPLPLVSLTFDNPRTRPTLLQIARLFAEVTESCPQYSAAREMCWWYCEIAIENAHEAFSDTTLREWKWAKWRYSFILCNNWIRRRNLERDAEDFEVSCSREMVY